MLYSVCSDISIRSAVAQELVPLKQGSTGSDFHLSCSLPVGLILYFRPGPWRPSDMLQT